MANNYDNAAWFYDSLSRVVFGRAIINAQQYLLQYIPPQSNILIVGGGTGWILEEITSLHPAGLSITYVEISAKMMALSRKRNVGDNEVTFINSAIENIQLSQNFDVIITPFLFDNFTQFKAEKIFLQLDALLKPVGIWLYADFELTGKSWQKMLLKTMHTFFKIICKIEARRLPDVKKLFRDSSYQIIIEKNFYSRFIYCGIYRN